MTALKQYSRLESPGLWRASPEAQRREVIVGFRDTSLILADPKSETPLAHWSLPAILREGASTRPAIYRPGPDATEWLEIDDETMIGALDRVTRALERRRPHPGRLRGVIFLTLVAALFAGSTLWLPGVLIRHTARVLPDPSRADVGQMAFDEVARQTGSACTGELGQRAASALSERLLGKGEGRIMVMRDALRGAMALPGGLVLISRDLVEAPPDVEVAAGHVLVALARQGGEEAQVERFLDHAGLWATLTLLVSGSLPEGALDGIGPALIAEANSSPMVPAETLLPAFRAAGFSPASYAAVLSGNPALAAALREGDPFKGLSPRVVLEDGHWISLQAICFDQ